MGRFDGQTVFITGGARGQGRSHAIAFAKEGADISILDATEGGSGPTAYDLATRDDMEATKKAVEDCGKRCLAIDGDVRSSEQVDDAVRRTVDELGGLDVAIANAGVFVLSPAVEYDDETWNDVIDVNVNGVFRTLRSAGKHMKEQGSGRLITISSIAGRMAFPNAAAYVASKWAVIGMTKTFAAELGTSGVTVNTVCPTNVDTPMITENPDAAQLFTGKDQPTEDEVREGASQFTQQGVPWVQPEDITEAVLFLASPGAQRITGEALTVSAGQIAMNAA